MKMTKDYIFCKFNRDLDFYKMSAYADSMRLPFLEKSVDAG